jgi:iron(III) transport system permease protein
MAEQVLGENRGTSRGLAALVQSIRAALARPAMVPLIVGGVPLVLIALLVLVIFYTTFVPALPTSFEWTLDHWRILERAYLWTAVIPNTLVVGVATVVIALFFACPAAWLMVRTAIPAKNFFLTSIALVMVLPPFVKSMGWVLLANDRIGIINRVLVAILPIKSLSLSVNNIWGIAWVSGLTLMPTAFFLIAGPMRQMDPAMEEAAVMCGANRLKTFARIGLPLVWPAIVAAAIYVFMTAISIFEIPAIIVGLGSKTPVLATEMFYAIYGEDAGANIHYGIAGVYGVLMTVPSLIGLFFYFRVINQSHRYAVVTGKGYRPRDLEIGGWKWLGLAFVGFYLLCATVLPLLWLIWISLASYRLPSIDALSHLNFSYYAPSYIVTAFGGWDVIENTALLIIGVCVGALFFSIMISWVVVRTKLRIRRAMDAVALLPHAIPGLAFAFGLFIVALLIQVWTGITILGTLGILIVANVLHDLSYTTRVTNSAFLQIHNEIEESSRVCGVSSLKTIFFILVPIVRPALVFATIWVALRTFCELTMALFLTGADNRVMAVRVWLTWNGGGLAQSAASAVVMTLGCAILLSLGFVLTKGRILQRV